MSNLPAKRVAVMPEGVQAQPASMSPVYLGSIAVPAHEVLDLGRKIALALADIIIQQQLFVNVQGKKHVYVEGWTTMGAMIGVTPREVSSIPLEDGSYEGTVELVRLCDGMVVGRASAVCGTEDTWKKREKHARKSMATTRATGKAFRLAFSWIMKLAGYEPTPAEEMPHGWGDSGSKEAAQAVADAKLAQLRGQVGDVDDLSREDSGKVIGPDNVSGIKNLSSGAPVGCLDLDSKQLPVSQDGEITTARLRDGSEHLVPLGQEVDGDSQFRHSSDSSRGQAPGMSRVGGTPRSPEALLGTVPRTKDLSGGREGQTTEATIGSHNTPIIHQVGPTVRDPGPLYGAGPFPPSPRPTADPRAGRYLYPEQAEHLKLFAKAKATVKEEAYRRVLRLCGVDKSIQFTNADDADICLQALRDTAAAQAKQRKLAKGKADSEMDAASLLPCRSGSGCPVQISNAFAQIMKSQKIPLEEMNKGLRESFDIYNAKFPDATTEDVWTAMLVTLQEKMERK